MKKEQLSDDVTLYCGDCLEVLPTLGKGTIDCIVTDPPYGHNNNNGDLIARREEALGEGKGTSPVESFRPIANDGPEANDILRACLSMWFDLLKAGCCCCCCCCCGGGGPDPQFARWSLWLDEVFDFKQMVPSRKAQRAAMSAASSAGATLWTPRGRCAKMWRMKSTPSRSRSRSRCSMKPKKEFEKAEKFGLRMLPK